MKNTLNIISALLLSTCLYAQTPADLLRGQESGVRVSATDGSPAAVVNTNIRGINSIWGSSEPLWVVDGAILNSSYDEVPQMFTAYGDAGYCSPVSWMLAWNPEDIESIEVLKNTSAAALYGVRGANGVVIINTKKAAGKPLTVDWKSNFGVNLSTKTGAGFKPGITHNHSVAASSYNSGTEYRISAFFRDNRGVVAHTGTRAAGLNALFDTHGNKLIHFGLHTFLNLSLPSTTTGAVCYGSPSHMLAIREIAPLESGVVNSLSGWEADHDDNSKIFSTTDIFHLDFNFLKNLVWRNWMTVDFKSGTRSVWYGTQTDFGKISATNLDGSAAGMVFSTLFTGDFKSELNWNTIFAKKNFIDIKAAVEYIYDLSTFNIISGRSMLSPSLRADGLKMMGTTSPARKYGNTLGQLGGYLRLAYDFDKIIGFDAFARVDNVKKYDDKNIEISPAANLFFDVRKAFFPQSNAVSALRIDAGYGEAGSRKYVPYTLFGTLYAGTYPQYGTNVECFYDGYNRVRTSELHAGITTGFISNRLTLKAEYYDKTSLDKLFLYGFGKNSTASGLYVATPRYVDFERESTVSNTGFDFDLTASIVSSSLVKWNVKANFSYNINKVASLNIADASGLKLTSYGMTATRNEVGRSVSSLYGYIMDEDNVAVSQDFLGDALPKYFGALTTDLHIGQFCLELFADGVGGNKILNLNRMLASGEDFPCSTFVEKGDYLRLSRVKAAYTLLPKKLKFIKSAEFSLTATNLATLTGYTGWNPDVDVYGTNNLAHGLDYGSYPLMRAFILGVNVKF